MLFKKASNDRDWAPDQAVVPHIVFLNNDCVRIEQVRDFHYTSPTVYESLYYNAEYDLKTVCGIRLIVSSFWKMPVAHVFLVFDFTDGRSLAVSIEARRTKDEEFSLKCLIPGHFEIIYVIADPNDAVGVRRSYRPDEQVGEFKLAIDAKVARKVFFSILKEAARLETKPCFYHPFVRSCSLDMIWHLRAGGVMMPRFDWRYVLPEHFEEVFKKRELVV